MNQIALAPLLQAIPCLFSMLLNLPEGVTVTMLGMFGFADVQKTNGPQIFGSCKPKKCGNMEFTMTACTRTVAFLLNLQASKDTAI